MKNISITPEEEILAKDLFLSIMRNIDNKLSFKTLDEISSYPTLKSLFDKIQSAEELEFVEDTEEPQIPLSLFDINKQ